MNNEFSNSLNVIINSITKIKIKHQTLVLIIDKNNK